MEPRKIEDGEIITEPGLYDMSIGFYHQQCCDGPSISSSGIRAILKSPAHYWRTSELNPNRVEEEDKEAFILGRAAHHLLLGEKDFGRHFVVRPDEAPDGRAWNGNNLSCKQWIAAQERTGRTVLTPKQIETIRGLAGLLPWQKDMPNCGLANTPLIASGGALSGEIERSLIFKIGGVWVKARPDAIPNDSNDFADLKTVSSKGAGGVDDRTLANAVGDRDYHVQGAVIGMAARAVLGRQMEGFHLVFVDTGDVHAVATKTIAEEDIVRGERAVFVALRIFEHCLKTRIWPGPTARQTDAQKLTLPAWKQESFDRNLDILEQEYA
ncbi:MAG: PD-(D/E)XK nuclease-like domain-containing protein [Devosia sp.]|nr:PD-(D/E)XK nuclease-like domain-containing protein [Devosia sp.]